jgi:hypothetical protein
MTAYGSRIVRIAGIGRRYLKKRIRHNACCDLVNTKLISRPEGAMLSILVLESWLRRLASGLKGTRYLFPGTHCFYNCSFDIWLTGHFKKETVEIQSPVCSTKGTECSFGRNP